MRRSVVREKMAKRELIMSINMALPHPRTAELIGGFGFDCLWICNEHNSIDLSLLENCIRAARVTNMDTMIRVGRGSHCDLIQPLEMGASGLMIPMVRNRKEAERIVEDSRFSPLGRRGVSGAGLDADLARASISDYVRFANDNTFVCLQIEDADAVERIDEIASVPGVDMLFAGPTDLSQSYGVTGELKHPSVVKAIKRVAESCERHKICCGTPGLDPDYTKMLIDMGVRFINSTSDHGLLLGGLSRTVEAYSKLGFNFR